MIANSESQLTNEDVLALIFHVASRMQKPITIPLLSELVVEARRKKLFTGTIPVRPAPDGYYSEYLAEHAALMIEGGLARKINPLVITDEGDRLLQKSLDEIKERNPEQARAWLNFLKDNLTHRSNQEASK